MEPCSAKAVANEFLTIAGEEGARVTPMKLQKLVYLAHGWHLGLSGKPLISELLQAWEHGPVVPSLYREFSSYRTDAIDRLAQSYNAKADRLFTPRVKDPAALSVIHTVWKRYKKFSATQLSAMSHAPGSPWSKTVAAAKEEVGYLPQNLTIDNDLIETYYAERANKTRTTTAQ